MTKNKKQSEDKNWATPHIAKDSIVTVAGIALGHGQTLDDGTVRATSTPGRGVHRGPTLPDWFRNTETLDEVSDLLDRCVRLDEVANKPNYNAEAIEKMTRARVNRFRRADTKLPKPPKSEQLISWQEWFTDLKATPTATGNGSKKLKIELRYARAYAQYQFAIKQAEANSRILRDEKEAYYYLRDDIEHDCGNLPKWKTWKVYLERYFHFVREFNE